MYKDTVHALLAQARHTMLMVATPGRGRSLQPNRIPRPLPGVAFRANFPDLGARNFFSMSEVEVATYVLGKLRYLR